MTLFQQFMSDESGATAIEYTLIAALIAVAAVVVLGQVGDEVEKTFTKVRDELQKANN